MILPRLALFVKLIAIANVAYVYKYPKKSVSLAPNTFSRIMFYFDVGFNIHDMLFPIFVVGQGKV